MKRVLFVCSRNRWRSPTAEKIFSDHPGIECASAGLAPDAEEPLTDELVAWADLIFVMERAHQRKLKSKFRVSVKQQRIVCLDIPDTYEFMDERLVALLNAKVRRFLPES